MLILARHGRTEVNAAGRLLGRLDPPLDDLGRRQAAALAGALRGAADPVVISSPLRRAVETATAVATAIGVEVTIDDQWIELDYGEFDGMPMADLPAATWRQWRSDPTFCPPGGESLATLGRRVRAALVSLTDDVVDRDVIVVSHVSPIKAAVAWALGVGDEVAWRLFLGPASICRVALQPWGPSLLAFNDNAHLLGLDTREV